MLSGAHSPVFDEPSPDLISQENIFSQGECPRESVNDSSTFSNTDKLLL